MIGQVSFTNISTCSVQQKSLCIIHARTNYPDTLGNLLGLCLGEPALHAWSVCLTCISFGSSAGCPPPSQLVNGSVSEFTSSRVGAQVTYSCDSDLVLVGERVVTCSRPHALSQNYDGYPATMLPVYGHQVEKYSIARVL